VLAEGGKQPGVVGRAGDELLQLATWTQTLGFELVRDPDGNRFAPVPRDQ
jgi:hypothetical protein